MVMRSNEGGGEGGLYSQTSGGDELIIEVDSGLRLLAINSIRAFEDNIINCFKIGDDVHKYIIMKSIEDLFKSAKPCYIPINNNYCSLPSHMSADTLESIVSGIQGLTAKVE